MNGHRKKWVRYKGPRHKYSTKPKLIQSTYFSCVICKKIFFVGIPYNWSFYHPGPIEGADVWYTVVLLFYDLCLWPHKIFICKKLLTYLSKSNHRALNNTAEDEADEKLPKWNKQPAAWITLTLCYFYSDVTVRLRGCSFAYLQLVLPWLDDFVWKTDRSKVHFKCTVIGTIGAYSTISLVVL